MNKIMIPPNWIPAAHQKWLENSHIDAIQIVLDEINKFGGRKPLDLVFQLAYYLYLINDHRAALSFLKSQCSYYENSIPLLSNIAVCHSKLMEYHDAIQYAEKVITLDPENYLSYDVLANNYSQIKQFDKASLAGKRSLDIKNTLVKPWDRKWTVPSKAPSVFASENNKRNVISFSLWGSDPRYLRGALRNLLLLPDFFPRWKARFYVDETVPHEFLDLLKELNAEVIVKPLSSNLKEKLCWRFLVSDDASVGYFLVRDVDSVFSIRESIAVYEWLNSDKWFHVIRDWWTHTDLILAGMWGGIAGVLPPMSGMIANYSSKNVETPNIDQWVLRDCVWAYIRNSCYIHDRFFNPSPLHTLPDIKISEDHHIGQNEFAVRQEEQQRFLQSWIDEYPCLKIK